MTEKIGKDFSREARKTEPHFMEVPNMDRKKPRRGRKSLEPIVYTTTEPWWIKADEGFKKDILARSLDRKILSFESMHTPCEI